jgi:hypothetical protein
VTTQLRPLSELIDDSLSAWTLVVEWVRQAPVNVEILPAERAAGEAALYATQVTTRSPMGAVVLNAAGLLIDGGWLRVLAAGGHPRFQRSLPGWNEARSNGFYLVADDAVGGFFALNGGELGDDLHTIYFYAPDSLAWEACELGYSEFLEWAMSDKLSQFYESLRWDGWTTEVKDLTADQVIGIYPFLFLDDAPIKERYRAPVPVAEQYALQVDVQRQMGW